MTLSCSVCGSWKSSRVRRLFRVASSIVVNSVNKSMRRVVAFD
jgi:uncharacterized Zn finger protein